MTTEATTQQPTNDADAATDAVVEDTALAAAANADAGEGDKGDDADTTDPAADAADEGDEGAVTEGAPEAYDTAAFTMPEGVEFDAEAFGEFEPALRELNLSQDQAGKLVSTYTEKLVPLIQRRTTEAFEEQAAELRANLARDLQADPEVGGKKLDESRAFAAKAIAHFIPKGEDRNEFSTFLNESGLGNHPLLMRLVAGAGRVLSEATTVTAETNKAQLSNSELFYGKGGK